MNYRKACGRALLGLIVVMVGGEMAIRASGAVDFPFYSADSAIGYAVRPNQAGAFLNKNHWVFNDKGMGTSRNWSATGKPNLLLIGNSIVMGGNPYDQPDKLGPLLQERLGEKVVVWPAAVGGWTNVNETVYLQRNPDVVKGTNFFIWEYMSGGFSQLSPHRGEYIWPTQQPICATCYVVRRYVLPRFINFEMSELPPKGTSQVENIARFEKAVMALSNASGAKTPGLLFIYPGQEELVNYRSGKDYAQDRKELERIAKTYNLKLVDIAQAADWNETLYRDGTHPSVEGNRVLAGILAKAVDEALTALDHC